MKHTAVTAIALGAVFFASCEKEIKVKVPEYKTALVVNSTTTVGDTLKVTVGKSIGVLKYRKSQNLSITDAQVALYKGGVLVENMKYNPVIGEYVSNKVADAGGSYDIKVSASGYESVEASTTVPVFVPIKNIQRIAGARQNGQGETQDEIRMTFTDPPGKGDFYIVSFVMPPKQTQGYEEYYSTCVNSVDASIESIHDESIDLNVCLSSESIFLKDDLFNGTDKELRLFVPSGFLQFDTSRVMKLVLKHVTQEEYRFWKTYRYASENQENPFAEPTNVYSNVKNGYGIFSVASYDERDIK